MTDENSWAKMVPTNIKHLYTLSFVLSAVFLGGFGAWAAIAPLGGAAVSMGVVSAAGQNQKIQHLEGGIVLKIFAHEGDAVKAGQPLVELDPTAALAQRDRLQKQLIGFDAQSQRLAATRDDLSALQFTPQLQAQAKQFGLQKVLDEQLSEFNARIKRHGQERIILDAKIQALRDQIEGVESQRNALQKQVDVVEDETSRKKDLLDKGLTNRSEYTLLLRSQADLVGQVGQAESTILSTKTQIAEAQEQRGRLETQRVEDAVVSLNDVRTKISDAEEQLRAAEDVLSRTVVKSPSDGIIIEMSVNSVGSVVAPGHVIAELLPTSAALLVEAHVSPKDVDVVHVGTPARLRFSSLNARSTPTVNGTVTYISADRIVDPQNSKDSYYIVRMRLSDVLPDGFSAKDVFPGMPVEAYISTGSRTLLQYLVKPITDSVSRAFREK
jgi:HlyD family type I secretion membrane fusion protein